MSTRLCFDVWEVMKSEREESLELTFLLRFRVPKVVTPIPVDGHTVIGSSIEHKCTSTPWVPPSERRNQCVSSLRFALSFASFLFFPPFFCNADRPLRLSFLSPLCLSRLERSSSAKFTPTLTATKQPGLSKPTKPSRTKRVSISSVFRRMILMEGWTCLLVSTLVDPFSPRYAEVGKNSKPDGFDLRPSFDFSFFQLLNPSEPSHEKTSFASSLTAKFSLVSGFLSSLPLPTR